LVEKRRIEKSLAPIPEVKICKECGKEFPITNYYQSRTGRYGLSSKCKDCDKKRRNQYYRTDKCQARLKRWVMQQHDKKGNESTKVCFRCNQELPITDFYTKINGKFGLEPICKKCTHDKLIEYRKTERYRDAASSYYHKEETLDRLLAYQKTDKCKAAKARIATKRRAKIKILSTLTDDEWKEIKRHYNYKCVYCGEKKLLTQDHIIPVSKGGHHIKENIVPACKSCNSKKGNRPVLLQLLPLACN
jgi:5-methylcytosine-specific restriction endonuclease McrA